MKIFKIIQPRLNYSLSFKDLNISIATLFSNFKPKNTIITKILSTEHVYFLDNARSGFQLMLSLLPPNSRVGVQPFTCPTVFEAIEKANCIIVFIDINKQLVIDSNILLNKVNELDAIILTHTFGYPADVTKIRSIFKNKIIIEDCAHGFMTKSENGLLGKLGDFSFFSFGFAKFPSAIRGGFVLINNIKFTESFKMHYNSLAKPKYIELVYNLVQAIWYSILNNNFIYTYITLRIKKNRVINFSYNKQISKVSKIKLGYPTCQAIFENRLENIKKLMQLQQDNGNRIIVALKGNKSFEICQLTEDLNYFMIPVLVKQPTHFIDYAKNNGIEIGQHFVQSQWIIPFYDYLKGSCMNYEEIVSRIVTIPTHYDYPSSKITRIVNIINAYTNE